MSHTGPNWVGRTGLSQEPPKCRAASAVKCLGPLLRIDPRGECRKVVVDLVESDQRESGDRGMVGLVPTVGNAALGGACGVKPVGHSRVRFSDHGAEHPVWVYDGLMPVEA